MRPLIAISLTLLLHLGGLAQMAWADDHGTAPSGEDCCAHDHAAPVGGEEERSHGCPEDTNCPVEGEHCHHHGGCAVHGAVFLFLAEKASPPGAPEARDLLFELLDDRPEHGPVKKLDKPPLI